MTLWNNINLKYNFLDNLYLNIEQLYKLKMIESDSILQYAFKNLLSTSIRYLSKDLTMTAKLLYNDTSFITLCDMLYNWNYFYIGLENTYDIIFLPSNYDTINTELYSELIGKVGYKNKNYHGNINFFKDIENGNIGITSLLSLDLSWLDLKQRAGIYNLDNNINTKSINMYSVLNVIVSPNIWLWQDSRFQPFVGLETTYIEFSGNSAIDPLNNNIFSDQVYSSFSSNLINIETGFLINGFKISYKYINYPGFEIMNTGVTYPITSIKHLEIVWQFFD